MEIFYIAPRNIQFIVDFLLANFFSFYLVGLKIKHFMAFQLPYPVSPKKKKIILLLNIQVSSFYIYINHQDFFFILAKTFRTI